MTIQTIRETLKLSRRDVAFYLGISTHMVKAIELDQRAVPFDSLDGIAALAHAILDSEARGPVTADVAPATSQQLRQVKRLYRKYSSRLNKYTERLEKMQEVYVSANKSLGIYQGFAASLAPARANGDRARLKWVKWKIEELTYRIKENNPTAQEILALEIAGLQVRMKRLEGVGQKT